MWEDLVFFNVDLFEGFSCMVFDSYYLMMILECF